MSCATYTTHEFADGATTCRCGKTRTVERTAMEPPPNDYARAALLAVAGEGAK